MLVDDEHPALVSVWTIPVGIRKAPQVWRQFPNYTSTLQAPGGFPVTQATLQASGIFPVAAASQQVAR